MRTPKLLSLVLFLFFCYSCNKPDMILGGKDLVYYDYTYSPITSGPITATDMVSKRVCYDLNSEALIWEQTNSKYPSLSNLFSGIGRGLNSGDYDTQNQYFFNTKIGDYLIRIFTAADYPTDYVSNQSINSYNGVYFQKIDTKTGNELFIRTLVPKSDFNPKNPFCISKVETDGIRVYFSCNNGFLYCFDTDGILVWKKNLVKFPMYKPNYLERELPYSFFGLNDDKIYIQSYSSLGLGYPNFKIINAITGNVVFDEISYNSGDIYLEKFPTYLFTDKYFFAFGYSGLSASDKYTGISPFPFVGGSYSGNSNYPNYLNPKPIGALSNNLIAFISYDIKLGYYDLSRNRSVSSTIDCRYNHGDILSGNIMYGGYCDRQIFEFSAINTDFPDPSIKWKKSFQIESKFFNPHFNKFLLAKNKLYLFANFYIENGLCKPNKPVLNTQIYPNMYDASSNTVLILNASDGSILKQCQNIPGKGLWYNISNE